MDLADLNARRGELPAAMGMEFVEASPERVVVTMPVEGNRQPFGLLHGGASGALIETAASIASSLHGMPMGKVALGVELSVSHHRGITEGLLTCTATPLSLGRTMTSYHCEVNGPDGRRIASGRLTCLLREAEGLASPPAAGG